MAMDGWLRNETAGDGAPIGGLKVIAPERVVRGASVRNRGYL